MTWGMGFGTPWGGGPLIPVDKPLAEIAGEPTTFDFSDEADGPLPGTWEFYALDHDGVGGVAFLAEPDPPAFFRVVGGLGLWDYTRAPVVPGPTDPFGERGVVAGPSGVLEGRNGRATAILRQPLALLDDNADEFRYEVTVALRLDPVAARWVGARMRAVWQAGVWVEPLVLEVVTADGGEPTVLVTVVPDPIDTPEPMDIWANQINAELEVEVRDTTLTATLSGILVATGQVPAETGGNQPALFIAAYNRSGATIMAVSTLVAAQFASLRDFSRLGPPPTVLGSMDLEAPDFPMIRLPIRDLIANGFLRQVRGRQFRFTQDVEVEVQHQKFLFDAGEVVRIREKLSNQDLVPATRDLHFERSKKRL